MKNILDQPAQSAICGILAVGGTFELAARYVGCSRKTIYNTANRDPEFREKLKQSQSGNELVFLNTIKEAGKQTKYWAAAKFALQHMYPERYARKPGTMHVKDVQDLVGQIVRAVVAVVPDVALRNAIRLKIRNLVGPYFHKAKEKDSSDAK
jgi:hypothetical protein